MFLVTFKFDRYRHGRYYEPPTDNRNYKMHLGIWRAFLTLPPTVRPRLFKVLKFYTPRSRVILLFLRCSCACWDMGWWDRVSEDVKRDLTAWATQIPDSCLVMLIIQIRLGFFLLLCLLFSAVFGFKKNGKWPSFTIFSTIHVQRDLLFP